MKIMEINSRSLKLIYAIYTLQFHKKNKCETINNIKNKYIS